MLTPRKNAKSITLAPIKIMQTFFSCYKNVFIYCVVFNDLKNCKSKRSQKAAII
jgi:hypothetical protein